LRQRYDEVGLPCSSTMGSPLPTSTYAISLPRTRRRCFGTEMPQRSCRLLLLSLSVSMRPYQVRLEIMNLIHVLRARDCYVPFNFDAFDAKPIDK
jgi:hypothetical protein